MQTMMKLNYGINTKGIINMYKIGVDLGGTNIVSGVVNEKLEIIGRGKLKTNLPRSSEEIFADICETIRMACTDAGIDVSEIESIGIGTPGSVNKPIGRIEFSNNLDFHKVDAEGLIHKDFPDKKVYLENDANSAALGEALAGAGKGMKSFVAITLGTGVGGGFVFDGKIITGCNDAGGEFGHIVIKFDGEMCNCGRQGCWESYASATALIRQTRAAMLDNKDTLMWELCDGKIENAGGRTAFDAMRKGDALAKEVVEKYIDYVAIGTTDIINMLQPDVICFGGGIANEGENLLIPLRERVKTLRYSRYAEVQTEIRKAVLGNDAGIIGAALVKY